MLDAALLDARVEEELLRVVRRAARQRRWNRRLRHGALVATLLATGIVLLQPRRPIGINPPAFRTSEAPYVIHSRVLPNDFVVRTQEKNVAFVTTTQEGVEFFSTRNAAAPERIDDEILLRLAPGAVLVRYQAGPAALVFPSIAHADIETRIP